MPTRTAAITTPTTSTAPRVSPANPFLSFIVRISWAAIVIPLRI
jgi:hypothetical protein